MGQELGLVKPDMDSVLTLQGKGRQLCSVKAVGHTLQLVNKPGPSEMVCNLALVTIWAEATTLTSGLEYNSGNYKHPVIDMASS